MLRSPYRSDRNPALAAPAPVWFGSDGNVCGSAVWIRCEAKTTRTTPPKKMMTKSRRTVAPRSLSLASRVRRRSLTLRLEAQVSASRKVKERLIAAITALPLLKWLRFISFIKTKTPAPENDRWCSTALFHKGKQCNNRDQHLWETHVFRKLIELYKQWTTWCWGHYSSVQDGSSLSKNLKKKLAKSHINQTP